MFYAADFELPAKFDPDKLSLFVGGINNEACNWSLPAKYRGGELKSGYRITAAFLKFVEENYRKDFVDVCHKALREQTFTMDLFKEATGLTADELWEAYKNA